jgi:hypothetical protein
MPSPSSVSIACASAFWGDTPFAVRQILREPKLDYIVFDYLSEVTMTLLARQKKRDPQTGYAADFLSDVIVPHLQTCKKRGIRLVANAGGCNPQALKFKIEEFAKQHSLGVKVAVVDGDDLTSRMPSDFTDLDGIRHVGRVPISANAYLGAPGLVAALETGADVVLSGRVVDSSLVLAPLVHEFNWAWSDFDLLAQGSLAGHIVECGAQACGGNFTDWAKVPGQDDIGFPIVHVENNGSFTVTKTPRSGGMVTTATVAEQIVYEIGDPKNYLLPDVNCDFSHVVLNSTNENTVQVTGARGRAPSQVYKVLATVQEGWKISATAFIAGGNAKAKAQAVGRAIVARCERLLSEDGVSGFSETRIETLGSHDQVTLRISAVHSRAEALEVLAKEIAPAATSLAPGLANLFSGRATPVPRIAIISFLWPKDSFEILVDCDGATKAVQLPAVSVEKIENGSTSRIVAPLLSGSGLKEVPLERIAYARSGDKGDNVNIGVIARNPKLFDILKSELSDAKVEAFFADELSGARGSSPNVQSWELPGFNALNFVLNKCLGGGGAYSLKVDSQGKAYAQRLLQMPIQVPELLLKEVGE